MLKKVNNMISCQPCLWRQRLGCFEVFKMLGFVIGPFVCWESISIVKNLSEIDVIYNILYVQILQNIWRNNLIRRKWQFVQQWKQLVWMLGDVGEDSRTILHFLLPDAKIAHLAPSYNVNLTQINWHRYILIHKYTNTIPAAKIPHLAPTQY